MISRATALVCLLGLVSVAPALAADDVRFASPKNARTSLSLGVFFPTFNTSASLDPEDAEVSALIRLEDVLGLTESKTEARLDGYHRFTPRHRVGFGYLLLARDGTTTVLDERIEWDEFVFDVGAEVTSDFDTQFLKLSYEYTIVRKEKFRLQFGAGLSLIRFDMGIQGRGTLRDDDTSIEEIREGHEDFLAPVPVLGIGLSYWFTKKASLTARLEHFRYSQGDWKALLTDPVVAFEFYPWKHFGFGVGYDGYFLDYVDRSSDRIEVDYDITGAVVYLRGVF